MTRWDTYLSFYIYGTHVFLFRIAQSLSVVGCPEFRVILLLLRPDLKDSLIPRRTKLHQLILQAWRRYFNDLRGEIAVCFP